MIKRYAVIVFIAVVLVIGVCVKSESSTDLSLPDPYCMEFEPLNFKPIKPTITTLKNGLEFWHTINPMLPLVTLIVDIDAGCLLDPIDKFGVAELTMQMLPTGGTESMTAKAFKEKSELMGLSFRQTASEEIAQLSVTCLSVDLKETLAMLMDMLQHPRFNLDELELLRREVRESIIIAEQEPFYQAFNTLRKRVYGDSHPSAQFFDKETLETISRDDLQAFHRAYYHPNAARFAVVGAVTDADIKYIKKTLTRWKGKSERTIVWPEYQPASETASIVLVDRPGTQAVIAMGHLGFEPSHPHQYNLEVFNDIYGSGGLSSRLMNHVRTQKGLAYMVFGHHSLGIPKGIFLAGCMTQNSSAVEAIKTILDVTRGMQTDLVGKEEMEKSIESIENSFVFRFESPQRVLQRLLVHRRRGLPDDYLETYLENVRKVTPEGLQQAAIDTIDLDKIQIIVSGPADILKPELEKLELPIEAITKQ